MYVKLFTLRTTVWGNFAPSFRSGVYRVLYEYQEHYITYGYKCEPEMTLVMPHCGRTCRLVAAVTKIPEHLRTVTIAWLPLARSYLGTMVACQPQESVSNYSITPRYRRPAFEKEFRRGRLRGRCGYYSNHYSVRVVEWRVRDKTASIQDIALYRICAHMNTNGAYTQKL